MAGNNTILVNVNLEISTLSLETIVDTAKQIKGRNQKGHFQVETADVVSEIISQFLAEKDFDSYVKEISNYDLPSMA